jgi:patatin-like phospholipase/acyl hydrolase
MGKRFKILSIDGGGILGLYSSEILKYIKDELLNGRLFSDEFQLITGTSTGGIIALALAVGLQPEEISNSYKKFGGKIFPPWRRFLFKIPLFSHKYSNQALREALSSIFKDLTISDCKTLVCIPAIDISNCQPIVFKTNNSGNQTREINTKLKDIALATSSAPTYFPIHSFDHYSGLVDGGLWQNNPALCGIIEAANHFVGEGKEYQSMKILSIGNPLSGIRNSISTKTKNSGLLKWNSQLVLLPMKITSLGTHEMIKIMQRNRSFPIDSYIRIESSQMPDDYKGLSLDSADDKSIQKILNRSHFDFYQYKTNLEGFFKEES